MSVVKMKKVKLIALDEDRPRLMRAFQRFGNLHIYQAEQEEEGLASAPDGAEQAEDRLARAKYALEFLKRYDPSQAGLLQSLKNERPVVSADQLEEQQENSGDFDRLYDRVRELDRKLGEIRNARARLESQIGQLAPWKGLEIPVEKARSTKNTVVSFGSVQLRHSDALEKDAAACSGAVVVSPVERDGENAYYMAVCHRDDAEAMDALLRQYGFSRFQFGELTGTVAAALEDLSAQIQALDEERKSVEAQAAGLAASLDSVRLYYDGAACGKDRAESEELFLRTQKTFLLQAWVPAALAEELEKAVQSVTDRYILELSSPGKHEDYPTLLQNPRPVKPFEFVTNQFSLPNPHGVDPNVIMAPFFAIFFGMMLSDAAYGALLVIATAVIIRWFKPRGQLIKLMFWCGLATIVAGAAFNSWFGEGFFVPLLLNPMEEPIGMLLLCLACGVVHVCVALGINAYQSFKDGSVADALCDNVSWILILVGAPLLAGKMAFSGAAGQVVFYIGASMAALGAATILLTGGRSSKNLFGKILGGLGGLYGISGYFGDILSYSRLFALGLATGVIGQVINSIALMVGGAGILGKAGMVVILIVGHCFNMAINVFGAYVHSARLQYVEFFGKFYQGDGVPFSPLRYQTLYTDVVNHQ